MKYNLTNSDNFTITGYVNSVQKTVDVLSYLDSVYSNSLKYRTITPNSGSAVTISNMLPNCIYLASGYSSSGDYALISSLTISSLSTSGYGTVPNNDSTNAWTDYDLPTSGLLVPQYCVIFECYSDSVPSITLPSNVSWVGGQMPAINPGNRSSIYIHCELIIMNNMATLLTDILP